MRPPAVFPGKSNVARFGPAPVCRIYRSPRSAGGSVAIRNREEYIFNFDNLFAEAAAGSKPHGGTKRSGLSILRDTSIVPARQLTSQV